MVNPLYIANVIEIRHAVALKVLNFRISPIQKKSCIYIEILIVIVTKALKLCQ